MLQSTNNHYSKKFTKEQDALFKDDVLKLNRYYLLKIVHLNWNQALKQIMKVALYNT